MQPESYPVEEIDTFFAAIRISSGYCTGYAQMFELPVGWASSYAANMIPIDGPSVESYPPFFKRAFLQGTVPTVSSIEVSQIAKTYGNLRAVSRQSTLVRFDLQ